MISWGFLVINPLTLRFILTMWFAIQCLMSNIFSISFELPPVNLISLFLNALLAWDTQPKPALVVPKAGKPTPQQKQDEKPQEEKPKVETMRKRNKNKKDD